MGKAFLGGTGGGSGGGKEERENRLALFINDTLTEITEEDFGGATSIRAQSFYKCQSLKSIAIPEGVTRIEPNAIYLCNSLESVTIPRSLTYVGSQGIYTTGTPSVVKMYITDLAAWCVTDDLDGIGIAKRALYLDGNLVTDLVIPNSITRIRKNALRNQTQITSVTIPDSVTSVGDWSFSFCNSLLSATFKGTPTSIGAYTFAGSPTHDIYVPWAEGEIPGAPWGASNSTVHYNTPV